MPQSDLALTVVLTPDQFEALAPRVADVLEGGRDDGFLDADGAAEYLGLTRKAIYTLVERGEASLPAARRSAALRQSGVTRVGATRMSPTRRLAKTRYRVCWQRGATKPRCWIRRTARIGLASKVFTPAPETVGVYVTRWYVNGRIMATWRFYNGPGD